MSKTKASAYVIYERIEYMRNTLENGDSFSMTDINDKFEISRATFFRDIAFMRDRLNIEIVCDKENGVYHL